MSIDRFAHEFEHKLATCDSPKQAPAQLADLFRLSFHTDQNASVLKHALQKHLLQWTLREAGAHTRFYKAPRYKEWLPSAPGEPPDLRCWPVIRRTDVIEHIEDMHADDVTFSSICHTSGCTGAPLSIYKSNEELRFLWDYYSQIMAPVQQSLASRPLVLSMPNLYHGTPVRLPSLGKVFVTGLTDDLLLGDTVMLLRKRFRIPGHDERFSRISGLGYQLVFFTNYLLEQRIDPREFNIQSITVVGGYIPRRWRKYLHDAWNAMIFDRFSLTESVGGATRCHACGYFHLDPHVIGEVLDDEGNASTAGIGRLVLTQLYPFVQMQPLIRYDTGDLVRRIESSCHHAMTFDFAGKSKNSIGWQHAGKSEWLLLSVDLHEILDAIPDIRRLPQFSNVRSVTDPGVASLPIYTLTSSAPEHGPFCISLTLELRYSPHFYLEHTAELRRVIIDGLCKSHVPLAARIAEGTVALQVEFVGPGKLGDAYVMKI